MSEKFIAKPLLLEFFCEELPPKTLKNLSESLANAVFLMLQRKGFIAVNQSAEKSMEIFATPRRLAFCIEQVADQQAAQTIRRKGPSVQSGLDANGKSTAALNGFLRSTGLNISQLQQEKEGEHSYFVAMIHQAGESLERCLQQELPALIKKLPIAKWQHWDIVATDALNGSSSTERIDFARPVRRLLALHGDGVLPLNLFGLTSDRLTEGHRFLSKQTPIQITHAKQYAEQLWQQGHVEASFDKREQRIRTQLTSFETDSRKVLLDEDLLQEVAALVEAPVVYLAHFDDEFLQVPKECLVLTMQKNQKYFPCLTADREALTGEFLLVSNMPIADPKNIITGNERVVRPRLADAKFFFEEDKKTSLREFAEKMAGVRYHNLLGSQGERIERISALALYLATVLKLEPLQQQILLQACQWSKADLASGMVGEFPELQGTIGRYIASSEASLADLQKVWPKATAAELLNNSLLVGELIASHYLPKSAKDSLPTSEAGKLLALADRLDALVAFFRVDLAPTGEKDPFGLRRSAIACLRLLLSLPIQTQHLPELLWHNLFEATAKIQESKTPVIASLAKNWQHDLQKFIAERFKQLQKEKGYAPDVLDAVFYDFGGNHPHAIEARVEALAQMRSAAANNTMAEPFKQWIAAQKRIGNLLKKSAGDDKSSIPANYSLLHEPAEVALQAAWQNIARKIVPPEKRLHAQDWLSLLAVYQQLTAPLQEFFEAIMVMSDDIPLRYARIALLREIHGFAGELGNLGLLVD